MKGIQNVKDLQYFSQNFSELLDFVIYFKYNIFIIILKLFRLYFLHEIH